MTSTTPSGISYILGTFLLLMTMSHSTGCPDTCFCMDVFVTCSDFKYLDLNLIPPGTDTLVLTRGEMDEIPSGFLAKAKELKMLEINSVKAKIVRSGAFSDLSNLDLFSITSSIFDIVESESFSGLTAVNKFHISDSKFGTVDKHAFANVNKVVDLRIWSSTFDIISDETFYKMAEITSFQMYQNNITSLGSRLFLESTDIDDITIYKNNIQKVSEGCFKNIKDVTSRMVLHANLFACSCDVAWILNDSDFAEYLSSNECTFPENVLLGISTFRMSDVTKEALCPSLSSKASTASSGDVAVETTQKSTAKDDLISTGNLLVSTTSSPVTPTKYRSTILPSSLTSAFALPSSTDKSTELPKQGYSLSTLLLQSLKTTTSLSEKASSSLSPIKPSTSELATKSRSVDFTDSPVPDDVSVENPAYHSTAKPRQSHTEDLTNINISDLTDDIINEGRTEPLREASVEIDRNDPAQSYSTLAVGMTTSTPGNASTKYIGNWLFIVVFSVLCVSTLKTF
uniref:LRRNT domain-containing protein n=1 Tax=Arion vulgaris TaxID=1028688 RepID=A0A0B7ADK8_9EUPU